MTKTPKTPKIAPAPDVQAQKESQDKPGNVVPGFPGAAGETRIRNPLEGVSIDAQIARCFFHQAPDCEQAEQIKRIRVAAAALAQIIRDNTPGGPDQTEAIHKVREAMMTAHASVLSMCLRR